MDQTMISDPKPPLVVVVGPTAVGKTEISILLAHRLDAEIVSADSRQFYRGMDIGTAKPTPAQRALVPHHLIDIADPDETLSLAVFQRLALEAISGIHLRGRLPLLVGGTGQYIRAVTRGWQPPPVVPDPKLRSALERMKLERGSEWLHDRLESMDPQAAQSIDHRNARRTIRALEVILTSGHRFSSQRAHVDSPYHLASIGLKLPRPKLYERIDARIQSMFESGLIQETQSLLSSGYSPALPAFSAIGYSECTKVISGELQVEEAKAAIRRLTRAFVRRQGNWFKESDPLIKWFEVDDANAVSKIESFIREETAV
jgi:tRNA dimethylallyltransferase